MVIGRSLRVGQRVPSTRALAFELKISRLPVLNAYAQLLAEGYLEARVGSGTFVCRTLPNQLKFSGRSAAYPLGIRSGPRPVAQRAMLLPRYNRAPWLRGLGAFSLGQSAYDQFPFQVWSSLVKRSCREVDASTLHYGGPLGLEKLRDAICTYLRTSRAVRCDPQQVMIVSGSQQALEISARVLLDAKNSVWVEEPGYWLTQRVLNLTGCRLIPVPVDDEGLDVAAGVKRCRRARAAFVTPSHQYPLGATMSASRRFQLLNWAESSGAWIIEDDYDSEYRYGSMPIASLQGLDSNSRVIYIGTFSKVLFPSLRVGYIVIPPDLVDRFITIRQAMDFAPAYLFQAILSKFMREGHFARHIRRMRVLYGERRVALVGALRKEFGSALELLGMDAGMHLVVMLPKGFRDTEIAKRAARENLWVVPLSPSYLSGGPRHGFVLGFASTPVAAMPHSVRQLKSVLLTGGDLAARNELDSFRHRIQKGSMPNR